MLRRIEVFQKDSLSKKDGKFVATKFLDLFRWQGLDQVLNISSNAHEIVNGIYPLNLGSVYRLSDQLAAKKDGGRGISVYHGIDREAWKEIERNNGILLLDMTVECFFPRMQIVEGLFDGIRSYDIDPNRVCVLNSNLASPEAFEKLRREHGFEPGPRILGFNGCYWLLNGFNRVRPDTVDILAARLNRVKSTLNVVRSKKFVSFNGRLRPHRFFVVLWLLQAGYLQDGHVSFLGYVDGEKPAPEKLAAMISRFPESSNATPWISHLINLMPLSLDVDLNSSLQSQAYINTLPWTSPSPEPYDDAYFSIIVDTLFDDPDVLFLTPIAFKSFMNLSPFVYFGNAGALSEMAKLGFQTFSPLIDESYDQIADHKQRLTAILQEMDRLLRLPRSRLQEIYVELLPRLEHNYNWVHKDHPERFLQEFNANALRYLQP